jgi:hypothetical protein
MSIGRAGLLGAAVVIGTTMAAHAQLASYAPYAYHPPYPYHQAPAAPPSWSYNPYTSGLTACLNWTPGDSPCREGVQPSFGQPTYQPAR